MTPSSKPVRRITPAVVRRRQIIVTLGPGDLIAFREKGRRTSYETTVLSCYHLAARQFAAEQARLKEEARVARGGKPRKFLRKAVFA